MLEARDQLRDIETVMIPNLTVEDQEEALDRLQEQAGYTRRTGGYRDDVQSISLEDFRREIRRGVNG